MDATTAEDLRKKLAEYDAIQGGAWGRPTQPAGTGGISCVSVPIKVQLADGVSIRCYLSLPAEAVASPEALMSTLANLRDAGLPLDVYEKQERQGWGRASGNGTQGKLTCFNCGRAGHMANECRQPGGGGSRASNGSGWGGGRRW